MNSYTGYPEASDLQALLEAAGLTLAAALLAQLDGAIKAAVRDFERGTGRRMLAVTETRTYDPPVTHSGVLLLPDDLAAAPESVIHQPTGSAATVFTLNRDYVPEPRNAPARGMPYTMLRFQHRRWTAPLAPSLSGSLAITGPFGYAAEIPEDAWSAMTARGGWLLCPQISQGLGGGLVVWKEADVEKRFSADRLSALRTGWGGDHPLGLGGQFGAAVNNYRRWTI